MTGESESMVERVARAIIQAKTGTAWTDDEWELSRAHHYKMDAKYPAYTASRSLVTDAFREARAAIEAMREPSAAIMDVDEWTGGELWRASIDAALSEGQEP